MKNIRPICLISPICLILFFLAGCSSYRWGSQLPPAYRDVAVPLFENHTAQPEVEALLTQNLRREITHDGALRLTSLDDAAIVIRGAAKTFASRVARYSDDMRDLPAEFSVTMTVEAWVEDSEGNILLPKKTFSQGTNIVPTRHVGGADGSAVPITDMPAAKQSAAIRLAALLARDILFYVNTPNE